MASTIVLELAKQSFLALDSANKQEIVRISLLQKLSSVDPFNGCFGLATDSSVASVHSDEVACSLVVELERSLILWVVIASHKESLMLRVGVVSREVCGTGCAFALLLTLSLDKLGSPRAARV